MAKKSKQSMQPNPVVEALGKTLNLDTLVFYADMSLWDQTAPIPKGWQVVRAKITSPDHMRVYFSLYGKKVMQSAQELFGLPAVVDGEITDWVIDIKDDKSWSVWEHPYNDFEREEIEIPITPLPDGTFSSLI